jgi:hypothetical protein
MFSSSVPEKPQPATVRQSRPSLQTSSSTWDSIVDSTTQATQRVSEIFTTAEDAAGVKSGGIMSTLTTWWEDTTTFIEDQTNSISEKIADLQTSPPVPDDVLQDIRDKVINYDHFLEAFKNEVYNFSLVIDAFKKRDSESSNNLLDKYKLLLADKNSSNSNVFEQLKLFREIQESSNFQTIRDGAKSLLDSISEEKEKISLLLTRFRRRDKIYQTSEDLQTKLRKKKEKNQNVSIVDSKVFEEIFELNTEIEKQSKEFELASAAIVDKANELLASMHIKIQANLKTLVELERDAFCKAEKMSDKLGDVSKAISKDPAITIAPFIYSKFYRQDRSQSNLNPIYS